MMTYRDSAYEFRAIAYDYRRMLDEAKAEIASLQAALARTEQNREDILNDMHTAWNDALEAAALRIEGRDWFLEDGIESTPSEDIRALRKARGL